VKLKGMVALVTGSGGGIGEGIAVRLAEEGADIAIHEKDEKELENAKRVATHIKSLGRRTFIVMADVTKEDDVKKMINDTIDALGKIDILVNNAGVISRCSVEDMKVNEWDRIFNVNVRAHFLTCREIIPHMKKLGKGKIINVSSIAGKDGHPYYAHYCGSKFAVVGFSNALAKELARDEITVNVICPGRVWTPLWQYLSEANRLPSETWEDSWARTQEVDIPQGRAQTPRDMGDLAVYFATSDNVTGQAHNVDGGEELH